MNNKLTDEELEALKKELKEELKAEMQNEKKEEPKYTSGDFKIPSRKTSFFEPTPIDKKDKELAQENVKTSLLLLFVMVILLIVGVLVVPKIYKEFGTKVKQEKIIDKKKEEPKKEKIEYKWEDEKIENIKLPVMRNNSYLSDSHYQVDSIKITDFSNNEILFNAFLDVYSGYIASYAGGYVGQSCVTDATRKTFSSKYIDARIKNMFTKELEYTHGDFYVPSNIGSTYPGLWKYDGSKNYVYYGDCNPNQTSDTLYYDILVEDTVQSSEDGKNVNLIYYIGFAKVKDNKFEIYKDADYKKLIASGDIKINTDDELKTALNKVKNQALKYEFKYTTEECAYQDFCYVSGEYYE